VGKWVRIDRRYNNPYRLTPYARWTIFKWVALVVAAVLASSATHGWAAIPLGLGLVVYAVHRVRVNGRVQLARRTASVNAPVVANAVPWRFNPPPGWPAPPYSWRPPANWQPDPSWPPAPARWQFWIPGSQAPLGERNTRSIPQDVKIAVAARDGGKCRQCGSIAELHYDHVIPWSKGGANTVSNIQLLCGPCNRRKGAKGIPVGS
jgi:hypothetical protein